MMFSTTVGSFEKLIVRFFLLRFKCIFIFLSKLPQSLESLFALISVVTKTLMDRVMCEMFTFLPVLNCARNYFK